MPSNSGLPINSVRVCDFCIWSTLSGKGCELHAPQTLSQYPNNNGVEDAQSGVSLRKVKSIIFLHRQPKIPNPTSCFSNPGLKGRVPTLKSQPLEDLKKQLAEIEKALGVFDLRREFVLS